MTTGWGQGSTGPALIDEAFGILQPPAGALVETACTVRSRGQHDSYRFDKYDGLASHPSEPATCYFLDAPGDMKLPCTTDAVASGTRGIVKSARNEVVGDRDRCVVRMRPGLASASYQSLDQKLGEGALHSSDLMVQGQRQNSAAQAALAEASRRLDLMARGSASTREHVRQVESQLVQARGELLVAEAEARRRAEELLATTDRLASSSSEVRAARDRADAAATRLRTAQSDLATLQASHQSGVSAVQSVQQQVAMQQAMLLRAHGLVAERGALLQRQRIDAQAAFDASVGRERSVGSTAVLAAEQAAFAQGLQLAREEAQREQVARDQEAERQRLARLAAEQAERDRMAREAAEAARQLQIRLEAERAAIEAAKVHCKVGAWGAWGPCSNACGSGTQGRTRPVLVQADKGGTACPALQESQPCSDSSGCPVNCQVGAWGLWGGCSTNCGTGVQRRSRAVVTEPKNGGAACPAREETTGCQDNSGCREDCQMGEWGAWSACSTTCGNGTQRRTRQVVRAPRNGGAACGPTEETRSCNDMSGCRQDCAATVSRGGCSASCGPGSRTVTISVSQPPRNGGAACPNGVTSTTSYSEPCNNGDCRVDCQYSTSVGGCSVNCGPGQRLVQYNISRHPSGGGAACPTSAWEPCNNGPCAPSFPGSVGLVGGRSGAWCADDNDNVRCNRGGVGAWERYQVQQLGDGWVTLRGGRSGQYCSDRPEAMVCNVSWPGQWERFRIQNLGGNSIALIGGRANQYCSDRPEGTVCNVGWLGQWEQFRYAAV